MNSLVKAMKNIWIRLRSNDNLKSYIQEISIIIKPLIGGSVERFFDIRLMNVEVSESNGFLVSKNTNLEPFWLTHGNLSDYPRDKNEGFGSQICREMILFASKQAIYRSETPECGSSFYYSYQQFTLPYQLHTSSSSVETMVKSKCPSGLLLIIMVFFCTYVLLAGRYGNIWNIDFVY